MSVRNLPPKAAIRFDGKRTFKNPITFLWLHGYTTQGSTVKQVVRVEVAHGTVWTVNHLHAGAQTGRLRLKRNAASPVFDNR